MEWNFVYHVKHHNQPDKDREIKGLIFSDESKPPRAEDIRPFLQNVGYNVTITDAEQFVFEDKNPNDPVEIRVVKLESKKDQDQDNGDAALHYLAEQFKKSEPQIG